MLEGTQGFSPPWCDMTDVYCPLEEILTMSDLPDSYKFRSGPGVSAQSPAKKTADLIEKETLKNRMTNDE